MADESALRRLLGVRLGRFHMYPPRPLEWRADESRESPAPLSFAIVTAVRNQAPFITRTIRSVLDQPIAALQYVVKDGASTDGTLEAALGLVEARMRVVSYPDTGLADGLNAGFALASGEIMGYLNGDDMLLPGALARVAHHFATRPEIDVVYGNRIVVDESDREIGRWVLPAHSDSVLSWDDYLPQETVFWRRSVWRRAGGRFDTSFSFAVDWDLWLRLRDCGARFARIPHFLGAFRVHPTQKTMKEMRTKGEQEIAELRRRSLGRDAGKFERLAATAPYLARHVIASAADRIMNLRP